jgi:general secretion pathway protein K
MVVVLVTMLATTLAGDFLVTFRRVENQLLSQQALAYLRGNEGVARSALQTDLENSPEKDHISEGWLNMTQEFPLEQGIISGTLCDLQGRLNVNTLAGIATAPELFTADQEMFVRLLQAIVLPNDEILDQQQAEEITNAVADWLDDDDIVRANGGAEDGYYAYLDLPYRPANTAMTSVSELRWVKGIDDVIFRALEPHITALPANVSLNINTATGVVLQTINELKDLQPLNISDTENLISERDGDLASGDLTLINTGFDSVDDFVNAHPAEDASSINSGRLGVNSDYFLLDSSTIFIDRKYRVFTLLHREPTNGKINVIARAKNGLGQCYALDLQTE